MVVIVIICFVLYCYIFSEYKIESSISNGALIYKTNQSGFEPTTSKYFVKRFQAALRDIVTIVALLILNGLIIKSIQRMIQNKKYVTKSVVNDSVKKLIKSKRRLVKMKIITNILNIIFHLPNCIYYFLSILSTSKIFNESSRTFLKLSYLMGFFIYASYNKIFRDTFLKFIGIKWKEKHLTLTSTR